jgi:hypothetical protein
VHVRVGPAKEPQIAGLAAIGTHMDQRENQGFKQPSAFRLPDFYALAHRATGRHSHTPWSSGNIRTRTRGPSVRFCTLLPAVRGEPRGTTKARQLLFWRLSQPFPGSGFPAPSLPGGQANPAENLRHSPDCSPLAIQIQSAIALLRAVRFLNQACNSAGC